jgi:hypothetical protein
MFSIIVNDEELVLAPNSEFTWEFFNAMFSEEVNLGGYSLPVTALVGAGNNDKILSFGYRWNIRENVKEWPCQYNYNGRPIRSGILHLLEFTEKEYMLSISFSSLPGNFKNKKLTEFLYDDDIEFKTLDDLLDYVRSTVTQSYPDVILNFPEYVNQDFYGELNSPGSDNPDFRGFVNFWDTINETIYFNTIKEDPERDNEFNIVPWLFANYVLKQIFKEVGWVATGTYFQHEDLQKLMLYNSYALDRKEAQYTVNAGQADDTEQWDGAWGFADFIRLYFPNETDDPFEDSDNLWDAPNSRFTVPPPPPGSTDPGYFDFYFEGSMFFSPTYDTSIELYPSLQFYLKCNLGIFPLMLVNGTSGGVLDFASFYMDASWIGEQVEIYVQPVGLDPTYSYWSRWTSHKVKITAASISNLNRYAKKIHLANHVPDITVSEFLLGLKECFNLTFEANNETKEFHINLPQKTLETNEEIPHHKIIQQYLGRNNGKVQYVFNWDFKNDQLANDKFKYPPLEPQYQADGFEDIPFNLKVGEYVFVWCENKWRTTLISPTNTNYKDVYSDNFLPYIAGEGEEKAITPRCAPMLMYVRWDGATWRLVPTIKHKGNSPAFNNGIDNETPYRICFWHGKQLGSIGKPGFEFEYPLASSFNFNYFGNQISNLSLRWDDRRFGLYTAFYRDFIAQIQENQEIEFTIMLKAADIVNFTPHKTVTIAGTKFIIKKVSIINSSRMEGLAKFTVVKLMI